jgi:pyroglutamyl-peptidase
MSDRTFVTGFLPFGAHAVNPSALLAASCGRRRFVIEAAYSAVDAFLDDLSVEAAGFDRLLMLGLRGGGTGIDVEQIARNHTGPEPDVRGVICGPGAIEPGAPGLLRGTLFASAPATTRPSTDAGCYLCNYIYYRALERFPDKRMGFVHVPPLEVMPLELQRRHLDDLLRLIA